MPSIGLGVIGAGYWGPKLVRTALATPQFQLRWLCDHHQDRTQAILGEQAQVRTTTSSDEVLGDPEVAAVAIATPAGTHCMLSVLEAASRSAAEGGIRIPIEILADQATVACMVPLSASLGPAPRAAPAVPAGRRRNASRDAPA